MRSFDEIFEVAADRHGGAMNVVTTLTDPLPTAVLRNVPLSVWLEAMIKAVFQAGFNRATIDAKWEAFRAAFDDFDPYRLAFYTDDEIAHLTSNAAIVRNGAKISAAVANARFLISIDRECGDAPTHFADWPTEDQAGLLALFGKRGARLGRVTAQRVCRMVGRDTYILITDLCSRLTEEGIISASPKSKSSMLAVQSAFNQ